MMLHTSGDSCFQPLFRAAQLSAFHLEVRDSYTVADEAEALRHWLAGEIYEPEEQPESWRAWDELMRETTGRGVAVERLRVVTVPHSTYTSWLLSATEDNLRTGEVVRWLPRHLTETSAVPQDDYWLFDRNTVAFTTFAEDGLFAGLSITTDPTIVERCISIRDILWPNGIEHPMYTVSEYAQA